MSLAGYHGPFSRRSDFATSLTARWHAVLCPRCSKRCRTLHTCLSNLKQFWYACASVSEAGEEGGREDCRRPVPVPQCVELRSVSAPDLVILVIVVVAAAGL